MRQSGNSANKDRAGAAQHVREDAPPKRGSRRRLHRHTSRFYARRMIQQALREATYE
jgi:hypothetical protein